MQVGSKGFDNKKNSMFESDTLVYLVEALAINSSIHKDIDLLYNSKRLAYRECAARSNLSKHPLILCGGIAREEYSKKALGILLHARKTRNPELIDSINMIIQKGWPRAWRSVLSYRSVDIDAYLHELRNGLEQNLAENSTEMFIFHFLCRISGLPIISPTEMIMYFSSLALRSYVHSKESYSDSYGSKDEASRAEISKLKDRVFTDRGIRISQDNQIFIDDSELLKQYRFMYRLAYSDKVELYYLFRELDLSEKDILSVLSTYCDVFKDSSDGTAANQFLYGIVIKMLVKSLIQAKEYYFRNSAEQTGVQQQAEIIDKLRAENQQLATKNRCLQETADSHGKKLSTAKHDAEKPLLDKIRYLEKQIAKQNELIQQERENKRELAALRNFFFSMDQQNTAQETEQQPEATMDLKDTVGAIVGGNQKWSARMKELLPNWVFIQSEGFDKRSLDNMQTVFFVPGSMSHTLYYKAVAIAKSRKMDIGFIHSHNEQLALKDIAKTLAQANT